MQNLKKDEIFIRHVDCYYQISHTGEQKIIFKLKNFRPSGRMDGILTKIHSFPSYCMR